MKPKTYPPHFKLKVGLLYVSVNSRAEFPAMRVLTFGQWQVFARNIRLRAQALDQSVHERAFEIARQAGITRDLCCIHNAAIDDNLTGWCYRNPARLKAAKLANHLLNQWTASRLADRIIARAWNITLK